MIRTVLIMMMTLAKCLNAEKVFFLIIFFMYLISTGEVWSEVGSVPS